MSLFLREGQSACLRAANHAWTAITTSTFFAAFFQTRDGSPPTSIKPIITCKPYKYLPREYEAPSAAKCLHSWYDRSLHLKSEGIFQECNACSFRHDCKLVLLSLEGKLLMLCSPPLGLCKKSWARFPVVSEPNVREAKGKPIFLA